MGKNFTYVPGAEFPYQYRYEHMAVTTDCVIFTYEDRQLKVSMKSLRVHICFVCFADKVTADRLGGKDGVYRMLTIESPKMLSEIYG